MNQLTIFSWFGFSIPMEERFKLIKSAGFDGVLLWWSDEYAAVDGDKHYGYLKGTFSMDGLGIDLWRGTKEKPMLDAIICTVDLYKKDSEIKLLLGCTTAEKEIIYRFHNQDQYMKGILIERDPNSL